MIFLCCLSKMLGVFGVEEYLTCCSVRGSTTSPFENRFIRLDFRYSIGNNTLAYDELWIRSYPDLQGSSIRERSVARRVTLWEASLNIRRIPQTSGEHKVSLIGVQWFQSPRDYMKNTHDLFLWKFLLQADKLLVDEFEEFRYLLLLVPFRFK
jgi:hypothetical protein